MSGLNNRPHKRIALLEDNRDQAESICAWVESTGDHCAIYTTAENFQRGFRRFTYDLIILDWILLEGSSGLEILYWIRKTVTSNVPIIFVTARNKEENIVTAILAGADDYLTKPIAETNCSLV